MFFKNTQLALLAISCPFSRICLAETNEIVAAAYFYHLPYYETYDENSVFQHWSTALLDKKCRVMLFEGGFRSIQPGRGIVCDIFS